MNQQKRKYQFIHIQEMNMKLEPENESNIKKQDLFLMQKRCYLITFWLFGDIRYWFLWFRRRKKGWISRRTEPYAE